MDGLEHRASLADVARGHRAKAADQSRGQVGEDVTEHVGGDKNVHGAWIHDHPHGAHIRMELVHGHVRVVPGHPGEGVSEETAGLGQYVGLVHAGHLPVILRPVTSELQSEPRYPLAILSCDHADRQGSVLITAFETGIQALEVLPHDHQVDGPATEVADRAQVGEQVELPSHT